MQEIQEMNRELTKLKALGQLIGVLRRDGSALRDRLARSRHRSLDLCRQMTEALRSANAATANTAG